MPLEDFSCTSNRHFVRPQVFAAGIVSDGRRSTGRGRAAAEAALLGASRQASCPLWLAAPAHTDGRVSAQGEMRYSWCAGSEQGRSSARFTLGNWSVRIGRCRTWHGSVDDLGDTRQPLARNLVEPAHLAPTAAALPRLSRMLAEKRPQHADQPRSRAAASDALDTDASPFEQKEDLISKTLWLGEAGFAAQRDKPLPRPRFVLLDHAPRWVVPFGKLHGRIGESAAAIAGIRHKVFDVLQPRLELALGIARVGRPELVPTGLPFRCEPAQILSHQHILRGEVAVERHLVRAGRFSDRVDADRTNTVAVEEIARRGENALARRHGQGLSGRMGDSFAH